MYSISAPNSKTERLIDELNRLARTLSYTPFDLVRLKKEAEDIKNNVDLASGFALLGMIACLESDEKAVRSFFKRAIEQSGGGTTHILNFAVSLKSLGFLEDAYKYAKEAYEMDPFDPECVNLAIEFACVLNRTAEFKEFLDVWHKMKKEKHRLEVGALFRDADQKASSELLNKYASKDALPPGNLEPSTIFKECGEEVVRIFGAPINIVTEVMPDPDSNPNLVAWIQWFEEMDEGMRLFDQFEQWYIDNDYDLKTDVVSFNIEFVGAS